jgi:general secretion pathway protein K
MMATNNPSCDLPNAHVTSRTKGLALVIVLWVVVVMTAIVAVVGQTSRLDMKMASSAMDEVRCRWACRAGVETAVANLNEDAKDTDSLLDLWSDNSEDFNNIQLERCRYSVRVTDEAGKLNINTATKEQLMALPYMQESIANAILDWRDKDDDIQPDGAEAGYYENMPFPYTIRNGPFKTIRELLRVKGVTEALLYGEDTNLNGRLDSNEMDGGLSPPVDNGDDYLDQGWIAYLTCYSYERNVDAEGHQRVNINQADARQLETDLGIKSSQAQWIVQNRGQGYKSIADLIGSEGSQRAPGGPAGNRPSPQVQNPDDQQRQGDQGNQGNQGNQENAEPLDFETFARIADRITTRGEDSIPGKININTASWEVLYSLFGGDEQAQQIAYSILSQRSSLLYGFQSIADLANVPSVGMDRFKKIADQITIRSDVFTIRCFAKADVSDARLQTEAVVDRSQTPCAVLYWCQGANE